MEPFFCLEITNREDYTFRKYATYEEALEVLEWNPTDGDYEDFHCTVRRDMEIDGDISYNIYKIENLETEPVDMGFVGSFETESSVTEKYLYNLMLDLQMHFGDKYTEVAGVTLRIAEHDSNERNFARHGQSNYVDVVCGQDKYKISKRDCLEGVKVQFDSVIELNEAIKVVKSAIRKAYTHKKRGK